MNQSKFEEGYKLLQNVVRYWEQLDEQTRFGHLSESLTHMREAKDE